MMKLSRAEGDPRAANLASRLPSRPVVFAWDLHYSCNYRCPYCFYNEAGWTELAKKNLYFEPAKWEAVWSRVHDLYGRCQLRITAGEPFTYPRFDDLLARVSRLHDLQVTTNCSQSEAIRRAAERVDPATLEFDCTYHPLSGEFEPFADNVTLLRERGFVANVCFLAYPPQMGRMAEYKRRFARRGLYMNMAIFWGRWKNSQYPFAYTDEERRAIKETIGVEVGPETVNLEPLSNRGKLCGAGQRYAVAQGDGRVFRCGQLGHEGQSIGSLFDPAFCLREAALACEADYCRSKELQVAWDETDREILLRENRLK